MINFDLHKAEEYLKNKEAFLSFTATNLIKKIINIENMFRNSLSYIKDTTSFDIKVKENNHPTIALDVSFNHNYSFEYTNKIEYETEQAEITRINFSLLSDFGIIHINDISSKEIEKESKERFNQIVHEGLFHLGFFQTINKENRFEFYSKSLHFYLDNHLHPHISDFLSALKNDEEYRLTLDVYGDDFIFLSTNIEETYYFEDEDIARADDLSSDFLFFKEINHIKKLINQIPAEYNSEPFIKLNIQPDFSQVIITKDDVDTVLIHLDECFDNLHKKEFLIDFTHLEKSIFSILAYFHDPDEYSELGENQDIVKQIILEREHIILKNNLKNGTENNIKKRL